MRKRLYVFALLAALVDMVVCLSNPCTLTEKPFILRFVLAALHVAALAWTFEAARRAPWVKLESPTMVKTVFAVVLRTIAITALESDRTLCFQAVPALGFQTSGKSLSLLPVLMVGTWLFPVCYILLIPNFDVGQADEVEDVIWRGGKWLIRWLRNRVQGIGKR